MMNLFLDVIAAIDIVMITIESTLGYLPNSVSIDRSIV
jgi:hypothetical protein